jgi:hypothetical protein
MFKLWKLMLVFLKDERGEEGNESGGDNGSASENGEHLTNPLAADDKGGAGTGQEGDPESGQVVVPPVKATPKYGEFGDVPDVDKLYDGYGKTKKELDIAKGKQTATERNLSSVRKLLESSGVRIVHDENGQPRLEVAAPEETKRQRRFSDEHKKKLAGFFDRPEAVDAFLETVKPYIEDLFEDSYTGREKMSKETQAKTRQFVQERTKANTRMIKLFPMLDGKFDGGKSTNPLFSQPFYDRATEIWQTEYKNNPHGELLAALDAADELGIQQAVIQAAKAEGVKMGKDGKKILSTVSSSGKVAPGALTTMTQAQYLALPPEKREEYDQKALENKK